MVYTVITDVKQIVPGTILCERFDTLRIYYIVTSIIISDNEYMGSLEYLFHDGDLTIMPLDFMPLGALVPSSLWKMVDMT
jgi:hypothetical protein